MPLGTVPLVIIGEGILKSSGLGFPIIPVVVVVVVVVVNYGGLSRSLFKVSQ